MKKYILILTSILLFACNNEENFTPQLVEVINQHGDIDTFNIPTDTSYNSKFFSKGLKLEDGELYNCNYRTILSGVFYYNIISSKSIKYKSFIVNFENDYKSLSQNYRYPDTLVAFISNDTIHLKPSDKRFKRVKRN